MAQAQDNGLPPFVGVQAANGANPREAKPMKIFAMIYHNVSGARSWLLGVLLVAAAAALMLARPGVMPASAEFPDPGDGVNEGASGAPDVPRDEGETFTTVSAGGDHTCGVNTDGGLACWGQDWHGEATPPGGTFQRMSAGGWHTCGLKADGEVACWGSDRNGQATPPVGTFHQVAAGGYHTCGLKTDGKVTCWGYDEFGQATPPDETFRRLSAGGEYTCGLKTDGKVACWGKDRYGEATPPVETFREISAGW